VHGDQSRVAEFGAPDPQGGLARIEIGIVQGDDF
jgi:hypothetical protein